LPIPGGGTRQIRHVSDRVPLSQARRSKREYLTHPQRVVRVTDRPATTGRSYLITRHVASLAELNALLADYLDQASRHGDCPMHVRLVAAARLNSIDS